MAEQSTGDAADLLAGVGRHWGWLLFFGIVNVVVGIMVVAWPGPTIVVLAVLFGIELIVAGIFRFVAAFGHDESGGTRVLFALLGVLSFIIGLYAIRHVLVTIAALALLLGIFWIIHGFIELFAAISDRGTPSRGWMMFTGGLSILAGLVVLVYPKISLVTLAVVMGVWLIVLGLIWIFLAFRLRSAHAAVGQVAAAV